jgi:hypothetical protein
MGLGWLAEAVCVCVGVTIAVDVGRAAVRVLGAVAGCGGNVGV